MNSRKTGRAGWVLLAASVACAGALPAAADVVASEGWARASAPGARTAAAYLVLTNTGPETRKLLKIVSPVSDEVSLHQSSVDAQGMARMWPLSGLELAPGQSVRFEPGGRHVMFNNLKSAFVAGQKVPLQLRFDGGQQEFTVQLEVRPLGAEEPDHSQHHEHPQPH
ncbi:MAG: copper chaperone PCu(A)C [Steroidobacteraceae bacterium]